MLMSLLSGVDDYETSDYEADTGRPTGRRPDQEGNDDDDHVEDADDNVIMMIMKTPMIMMMIMKTMMIMMMMKF